MPRKKCHGCRVSYVYVAQVEIDTNDIATLSLHCVTEKKKTITSISTTIATTTKWFTAIFFVRFRSHACMILFTLR